MIEWQTLHAKMLADIEGCRQMPLPEIEQVEHAFKIAGDSWHQLKSLLKTYRFSDSNEEINFYKNIKPAFTSYIEYYTMMYSAQVLQPAEDVAAIRFFWEKEAKRLGKFLEKDASFVEYYKSGGTGFDSQYFLPDNYDLAKGNVSKPYETYGDYLTSHDHIVAGLFAQEMYHEYVQKKLGDL